MARDIILERKSIHMLIVLQPVSLQKNCSENRLVKNTFIFKISIYS